MIAALSLACFNFRRQLQQANTELESLRQEVGYLPETADQQVAAARAPSDLPLTYRFRVRVPSQPKFRIAYSSLWEKDSANPSWYSAIDVPPGDSTVLVRILEDPRDEIWKITTLVRSVRGTKRMATTLPEDHVAIFRQSNDVVSASIGYAATVADTDASIRMLDERWLVGEGAQFLYGDKPPEEDQIGVFAELQRDVGPL